MIEKLVFKQDVNASIKQCWDFFSRPSNLKLLTPSYLGFTDDNPELPMYAGQIILHRIRIFGVFSSEWMTEITHVAEPHYFIDEQRSGPYKFWHHEHRFSAIESGVEIADFIHYKLPFGILGTIMNNLKIKHDLAAIFLFRQKRIAEIFNSSQSNHGS